MNNLNLPFAVVEKGIEETDEKQKIYVKMMAE